MFLIPLDPRCSLTFFLGALLLFQATLEDAEAKLMQQRAQEATATEEGEVAEADEKASTSEGTDDQGVASKEEAGSANESGKEKENHRPTEAADGRDSRQEYEVSETKLVLHPPIACRPSKRRPQFD